MPTLETFLAFTFLSSIPAIVYGVDALVRHRRVRRDRDAERENRR